MSFTADTTDAETLATRLLEARDRLGDLQQVNTQAGAVVEARALVPRRTGALAGSVEVVAGATDVVVGSNLRYATFVHWGAPRRNVRAQPFLLTALEVSTAELTDLYTQHAQTVVSDI